MTSATTAHQPVLLSAVLDGLRIDPAGTYIDGTFGRGGHSRAMLARLGPDGRLLALDRDPEAVRAGQALAAQDARFSICHTPFSRLGEVVAARLRRPVQGILLDLGVSSPQLDEASRGFSFMREGPLDMRMDPSAGESAAEWLTTVSETTLKEVIARYGEERFAASVAKAIVARREQQPIRTTRELAELVAGVVRSRETGQHPATRTFQALRIYLNQELAELSHALSSALNLLAECGRLAVIAFHSLEDRIVKRFMAWAANPGRDSARLPLTEAQRPSPLLMLRGRFHADDHETARNPRARSAVLRVAERSAAPLPADWQRQMPIDPLTLPLRSLAGPH